jgi:hypothetical protein
MILKSFSLLCSFLETRSSLCLQDCLVLSFNFGHLFSWRRKILVATIIAIWLHDEVKLIGMLKVRLKIYQTN